MARYRADYANVYIKGEEKRAEKGRIRRNSRRGMVGERGMLGQ